MRKWVDSPNKISAKTVFRTSQENKLLSKVYCFKKWKNMQLKMLAFIPLQYPI